MRRFSLHVHVFLVLCGSLPLGVVAGLSVLPSFAAEPAPRIWPGDAPLVALPVRQAMQDRSYPEARKAIAEAAAAKDAPRDYLAWLNAWSFYLEKQHDAAITACAHFAKDFPKARGFAARGSFKAWPWPAKAISAGRN